MGRLRMRTFIAVPLDDAARRRVSKLLKVMAAADPEVKWVEPENLHFTLQFLGEIDAREVVAICRAVRGVVERTAPFTLETAGVGCFPNARRPRTLWVGAREGREELMALHAALETELLQLGTYRREDREYSPHLTLGRVKSDEITPQLRETLDGHVDWKGGQQIVSEIHVMSSELTREGPLYTVVSRERLRGEAASG
mgnify:CR=1 FL=1